MDKDDGDKDSLDLDNDKGLAEALAEALKEAKAKKRLLISVTGSFVNVADGYTYYVVTFPKPVKTFYLKAEHYKTLLKHTLKKCKVVNPTEDGAWIETISYYHMHDKEYGAKIIWHRTSSNKKIDLV